RQLAEGGPITVTHEEMTRYFMTIPEAASLVIQASAIDAGPAGGVFELDMGEPVNIRELAERFVRIHGLVPEFDLETSSPNKNPQIGKSHVRILFTGIRPGEKLHEELAYQAEELRPTEVPGVRAWAGESPPGKDISRMVTELSALRNASRNETVLEGIKQFVPSIGRTSERSRDAHQSSRTA
ncbi:polysaccharide biosynthesis protein, partial [Planctomycetaceae bacterium AH-315-I19]|nr:polysaccharide biosynthesis protein [Planctomycetaceae bacterium AH-315-I19]